MEPLASGPGKSRTLVCAPASPQAHALLPAAMLHARRWAGNNVTRPFRLAGAAALAPFMDRLMERLQGRLGLKSKAGAFAILVTLIAGLAFSIQGEMGVHVASWVPPHAQGAKASGRGGRQMA